jgi:hypothetical protein
MKLPGLTDEQTTSLCHLAGVGGAIATLGVAHVTAIVWHGAGWVPPPIIVTLEACLIAGGIFNNWFNTPKPGSAP